MVTYQAALYTGLGYGLQFHNPGLGAVAEWESPEAIRRINIRADTEIWAIEGDSATFDVEPQRNQLIGILREVGLSPKGGLCG